MMLDQDFLSLLIHLVERAEREGHRDAQRMLLPVVEALAPRLAVCRVPPALPSGRARPRPDKVPGPADVFRLDDYRPKKPR